MLLPWCRSSSYYAVCQVIPEDFPGIVEVQHAKSAWRKEPWNLETQLILLSMFAIMISLLFAYIKKGICH